MPEWRRKRERRKGVVHESRWLRMREWCRGRNPIWRLPLIAWVIIAAVQFAINTVDISGAAFIATQIHVIGHFILGFADHPFSTVAGPLLLFGIPIAGFRIAERMGSYFGQAMTVSLLAIALMWYARFVAFPGGSAHYMFYEANAVNACDCGLFYESLKNAGAGMGTVLFIRIIGVFVLVCMIYILASQMRFMFTLKERRRRDRRRHVPEPVVEEFQPPE